MKIGAPRLSRQFLSLAVLGVLLTLVAACTGRGGGQLPPETGMYTDGASFGFTFSCQDSGGINTQTGQLKIELSYTERGTVLPPKSSLGGPFGIHGIVDQIDPVLESAVCIGQNPPPGGNVLIFLGRYYLTSSAPAGFPSTCANQATSTAPLCRFEVDVVDNDKNKAPSPGDQFQIMLSSSAPAVCDLSCSQLQGPLFYTRSGYLSAGNITVN